MTSRGLGVGSDSAKNHQIWGPLVKGAGEPLSAAHSDVWICAGGNALKGTAGSATARLRPSVRIRRRGQFPDLVSEQAQVLV